jgi:glycosyltransferase involved in cell wall biosynthesis
MHIAFLDSWLRQAVDGSGTAVAIGGIERALRDRGVRVGRIGPTGSWPRGITARRLLFNLQLPMLLRSLRYDLVVGFDIDGFLARSGRAGTPYVVSVKGVIAEEFRHEQGAVRRLLWGLSLLEGRNVRQADAILTTSDYCRSRVVQHYAADPLRVGLVPEGIALSEWPDPARAGVARDPFTVLCVARQYPRKHVADLLRAFALVRRREPRARLVIVGDGPEHPRLRELARELGLGESALFLGGVPDDAAVREWYYRSALFCLPSVQEGFGIVLLEAMAAGVPVVATTAAAVPEVVPHGEAGLLVPPADVPALAEALGALLAAPDRRATLGSFGRAYVARFDWPLVADAFLSSLVRLLPGSTATLPPPSSASRAGGRRQQP